jgi:hypothetical protein
MTDTDHAAARARGHAIRGVRMARARRIRQRVIAGALALFVASWLFITLVLVSGHDPALAKRSSAATVASTPSTTTATTTAATGTTTSSGATTTTSGTSGSSSSSSGSTPSSVTTSQS